MKDQKESLEGLKNASDRCYVMRYPQGFFQRKRLALYFHRVRFNPHIGNFYNFLRRNYKPPENKFPTFYKKGRYDPLDLHMAHPFLLNKGGNCWVLLTIAP